MLDNVSSYINDVSNISDDFEPYFINYINKVQDMDIENEILPLIKDKTTTYLTKLRRLDLATRKRREKRLSI